MGIDIFKCKAIKENHDKNDVEYLQLTILGKEIDDNKYLIKLKDVFKDFIVPMELEHYDFEKEFSNIGLDYKKYKLQSIGDNITFYNIDNFDETLSFDEKSFSTRFISEKVIYYKELSYQRKGMKDSFYTDVISGSYKISENKIDEYNSMDYILNNGDLEIVKMHAEDDSDLIKWMLADDEFIIITC